MGPARDRYSYSCVSCISDVPYKSYPSGAFVSQVWLPACGLSSNTAGNGWPEGPPHSSPALLLSAPVQPGPQPSTLRAVVCAKSQGKAEVPEKLWLLPGWLPCRLIHLCFCPFLLPSVPQHSLWIHPVFCCCILSFPCSCIIQLSFSGSVFAPSFSPLSSPCSMCRRKTASCAIQPCEPWVMTEWKEKEGRQP